MLRALRTYSSSTGVKILYGLLALTFIAWGAGTMGLNRLQVVAEVHGERITQTDVAREAALLEQQFRQLAQGAALPPGFDFRAQALDRLVTDALLRHEAIRLGLGVSDDELVATITEMPQLQRDGRFDRDLLERFLELQRDRGEFEADMRRQILADRLRGLVVDGLEASEAEVRQEYDLQFAAITVDYVRVAAADEAERLAVTDEALADYVETNRERYLGPEKVRARYVALSADAYEELAQPSASEIEAYYQKHLDAEFTRPEQVRARHILVKVTPDAPEDERTAARARIDALRDQIAGGADFAAIATEHSDDGVSGAEGGDLGWFGRGKMDPGFEAAAFSLEVNELSDVVETPFGFHLILVDAHEVGGPQALSEVRDAIVKVLANERGLELARNDADAIRRAVVEGKTLDEAAGDHPVLETDPFAKGSFVPGIGAAPTFSEVAFSLRDGEVSDIVEEASGIYLLVPVDRTPRAVPPLDEIRARVEADYRRDESAELAKKRAEAVLARAREVGLRSAAKEAGLDVRSGGPFSRRDGSVPDLGAVPGLIDVLPALDADHPLAPEVYVAGRDAVVAALAKREPPSDGDFAAERASLAAGIRERRRTQAFTRYIDLLKQRAQDEGALMVRADAIG